MENKQLNAHEYESIYSELNINLNRLGCVMKDIAPMSPTYLIETMLELGNDSIVTNDEEKPWINGLALANNPHITLLYGLMENAHAYEKYINELMEPIKLPVLTIASIGDFDSPYEDDPYYCIVAHIELTAELLEAHARLSFLPHIDTYSGYKPHLTLAYVKKDASVLERMITYFERTLSSELDTVEGLNLGYDE